MTNKRKDHPKYIGLNFLIFKGDKDPLKISKDKITNLSDEPTFDQYEHKSKNMANFPPKSKPITVSRPYVNLLEKKTENKYTFNNRQKRQVPQKNYDERGEYKSK